MFRSRTLRQSLFVFVAVTLCSSIAAQSKTRWAVFCNKESARVAGPFASRQACNDLREAHVRNTGHSGVVCLSVS